jgi:hypothetical protein
MTTDLGDPVAVLLAATRVFERLAAYGGLVAMYERLAKPRTPISPYRPSMSPRRTMRSSSLV